MLQQLPNNKRATDGLNNVFNQYLKLAIDEARNSDFDNAAEYYLAAKKLKPNHEKLKTVGQEISRLQNK